MIDDQARFDRLGQHLQVEGRTVVFEVERAGPLQSGVDFALVDPQHAVASRFFWQEYLAGDAPKALDFYKRLAGYESTIKETRLGVEYHVLRTATLPRAGLFQLPDASDVLPSWLPYVLVADPSAVAAKVPALGGTIVLPAAQERRNGSLVVITDPGGALLALQKYPY